MRFTEEQAALLDAPLDTLEFVVFDIEATGVDPEGGDRMVEIGAVRIRPGFRVDTRETFETLVDPERDIPQRVIDIHGITNDAVSNAPDACTVVYDFMEFARGSVLAAHDARKDIAFLRETMLEYGISNPFTEVVDTLRLSRRLHPHARKHTLDDVSERLNVNVAGRRHRALYDAKATAMAFRIMLRQAFETRCYTLFELLEFTKQ